MKNEIKRTHKGRLPTKEELKTIGPAGVAAILKKLNLHYDANKAYQALMRG